MEAKEENGSSNNNTLMMASIGVLVVFIGVVFFLFMWVSNKGKASVVFPAGINYTGTENQQAPVTANRPIYDYAKYANNDAGWITYNSLQKQYSFKHPVEMVTLVFPGDTADMATFDVADVPAQFNIMSLIETISERDPKYVGKPQEFVSNYWHFFGGLKGLSSIEPYSNKEGLKGFKAIYMNKSGTTSSENYFFVIPGDTNRMIHFSNVFPKTPEAQQVFMKILDSVSNKMGATNVTPTAAAK